MPGVGLQDVWTDIDPISARTAERLGYPTQKPEALLERIIAASSDECAIVLDPFCGCGTTVAVAERMRRRWIGIDISPTAVNLMRNRLERLTDGRCTPKVIGLPVKADELRRLKPFEFQNWVIQRFRGTHSPRKSGDMGIDGYSRTGNPIQVKRSDHVGRNRWTILRLRCDEREKRRGTWSRLASPVGRMRRLLVRAGNCISTFAS